ncbi:MULTISPECIES: DegT/DnrJ/EryC1/StrS family aminotransferase [Priestia]|uniref:DegT/DnrJ/EryC1/StrS family aminotransferase n=1 Tax=Priestia TaxID=2800373 RepID=UPI001C8E91B1|nr:DegT/DnrJ/EryC1/StrS aminotransferase family protein [Priestia aryabhattai]MBY0214424.1 DegT/DnrJ/EryC1/StrS aminotransferase family protein [Priestia aryabhattai]MDT0148409.1 DegT/DnrJ/EryC1/StrS aminotransferase family protein [Priestia aryabhattai]MDT0153725.1 DegT/DnrJ/EryC1/StrS aminotransferase family protein [Priestia aryabhattai]
MSNSIKTKTSIPKYNVPFSPPDISEAEINEVIDTLKSGWITTGPKTKLLERKIAEFTNASRAVCVNSATAAMELTLRLLGVGEGDEVITSAYTYTASASVIKHVGAKIVLVDTAKDSFEMDYDQLKKAITSKTKVIIPVDIAGVMCDYNRIFEIVKGKSNLFIPNGELQRSIGRITVLADAAHSFGASYHNMQSGGVADFTSFSFHAVKNFTTGEGGAVTWRNIPGVDNKIIYDKYMLLSLHGQSKDALAKTNLGSWEYDILLPAYKCNMTDIMASIGLGQMTRYRGLLERRKEIIERYNEKFTSHTNLQILKHYADNYSSSGHLYLVRLIGENEQFRNKVISKMAEMGISTNVHYKPLPLHSAYKDLGFNIKDFPNAYDMYKNEITLPLNTLMTNEEVDYVADALVSVINEIQ